MMHGAHAHHHRRPVPRLRAAGYHVRSQVHVLARFGLPQVRERAGRREPHREARTHSGLRQVWTVRPGSVTVRTALARLAKWADGQPEDDTGATYAGKGQSVAGRIAATPLNGGVDRRRPESPHQELLTADWQPLGSGSGGLPSGRLRPDRAGQARPSSGSARTWATAATHTRWRTGSSPCASWPPCRNFRSNIGSPRGPGVTQRPHRRRAPDKGRLQSDALRRIASWRPVRGREGHGWVQECQFGQSANFCRWNTDFCRSLQAPPLKRPGSPPSTRCPR